MFPTTSEAPHYRASGHSDTPGCKKRHRAYAIRGCTIKPAEVNKCFISATFYSHI